MLQRFIAFIESKKLFTSGENILLAVSGGIDSMVMAHLFIEARYSIAICHLNHKQRGTESDQDALFVKNFAELNSILFFQKEVDFNSKASSSTKNFQELAREERYKWFDLLCKDNDLQKVATAHHKDDEIESFIFNLSRKSGLKGLSGIPAKRNNIVRPLLFTNRDEIKSYAKQNSIKHREDSSNIENKYRRNFIRNEVIPKLLELNPNVRNNISDSIVNLQGSQKLMDFLISNYQKNIVEIDRDSIKIRLSDLGEIGIKNQLLYQLIKGYGYNYDQVVDILKSRTVGSLFYSPTHKAVLDRDYLIIKSKSGNIKVNQLISESATVEGLGYLKLDDISHPQQFESNPNLVHLDKKLLEFPLCIRNWQPGDQFHPLGMEGSQKVKDFLTNNKVDRFEKEKVLVLCSGEQICWVVGWRMDDHFKLTDSSERVLRVEWDPKI